MKNSHIIKKIRRASGLLMTNKTPRGFLMTKETTASGIRYEKVVKKDAEKTGRVIFYLHGGAYVAGLISTYRNFAVKFYDAAQTELILLDYSLAPEAKFPTQLNEAVALWEDLIENQGYLAENIIIGGDSAGANLALALLLKLRDEKLPLPKAAFCMSPWADMTASGKSYVENYSKDIMFGENKKEASLDSREKILSSELYCFIGDANRHDPYVSPVFGDYHGFPPMFFTAGGHEMLLDDTLTIVKKLKKSGASVQVEICEEMFHTYPIYSPFLPEGEKAFDKICEFIKTQFCSNFSK